MIVSELIEQLQKMPQDLEVVSANYEDDTIFPTNVEEIGIKECQGETLVVLAVTPVEDITFWWRGMKPNES